MSAKPTGPADDLPVLAFADAEAFERWLETPPAKTGLWLKIAKKGCGVVTVNYAQALDVALCHGWIDGQKRSLDETYFLQRFVPRRARSLWSQINIGKCEQLIAQGRMRAGGQREIDAAQADGRWQAAYASASKIEMPEDLAAALAKSPKARKFFDALDGSNRYAVLWRVTTAKKADTRAARIAKLVEMLARGEKIHK
ncbi:YdeI/OmpD-associated family protein [Lysobacter enzymogenes]|uniref:YdeI/OmpD-associated family protein n=1 Tax=Lysobacter enzymogenes TaxID=69 RepID=UPI001A979AFF|nr:YdeI/OmpD-associated family protein [Lysobacter enzymogenes]QQP96661.1 YdeI/OmpD-associated family protein [Lysobacter enzymogenes]